MASLQASKALIAVVLLNLGGPEQLEDVRPFLYNLFSDRQIIQLGPAFLQKPIAWWIAKTRAPKSQGYYRLIGGGSPLKQITAEQGRALSERLQDNGKFMVTMAMRYWDPFAEETLQKLADQGVTRIVALTLYPHYSLATTGSSLTELRRQAAALPAKFDIVAVDSWPDEQHYIKALSQYIIEGLNASDLATEVVYSAHSLPVKFIDEGDPYVEHLRRTIAALEGHTGRNGTLCFQSRSGPVEWLAPSTPEVLEQLAAKGCKRVLIVPLSFVSDHVETLYEIDIQYKKQVEGLGMAFARTPSLNSDPLFIEGLAELVVDACRRKGW